MLYRFFIIFSLLVFFATSSQAQTKTEDIVYLKNGGVTKGQIIEIIPDSIVKIQTKDKYVFVYKYNQVQKIVRQEITGSKTTQSVPAVNRDTIPKPAFKDSGFYTIIKLGPGNSSSNYHIINGYQFNPYLLLGFGVGLDAYVGLGDSMDLNPFPGGSHSRLQDYFLPIFIDLRCHIKPKSRATLVTFMDVGYSAYLGGKTNEKTYTKSYTNNSSYSGNTNSYNSFKPVSGGAFLCTGLGVRVFISKRIALITDLGLKLQLYTASQFVSDHFNGVPSPGSQQARTILFAMTPALNIGIFF
jgi:hypothetical protein